jgi:hypothetical protein
VAKLTPEQRELRLRLCAHLRRLFEEHRFEYRQDMAAKMGIDPGHFSVLFNGKTDIGLDVAWIVHRTFGESLNALCDTDPPAKFYPPGTFPGMHLGVRKDEPPIAAEGPPPPWSASQPSAQARKRRHGGSGRR